VTRQADGRDHRELRLEAGSFDHYRGTFDLGRAVSETASVRVTGLLQDSGSYRDGVSYEKFGVNPTGSFRLGPDTLVQLGYEYFSDDRVADRGVSSFQGRPLETDESTFFDDPGRSPTDTEINALTGGIEHRFGNGLILRNRTRLARYDKFYQNVFPGAVNATGDRVTLAAYQNRTDRENLFNQTDLNFYVDTGPVRHVLLAGLGVIAQGERFAATDNRVVMDGFTRVDGAVFYALNARISLQANVENLLGEEYFAFAHNNNNITPGSPRALRVGLTARY